MFDDYFDVFLADTYKGREEHYRLRYQVYCEEMGFEEKNELSSQLEIDQWDKHSVHFLVRHKETGQWVGAMRMVFRQDGLLPFQKLCSIGAVIDGDDEIEISRLCLTHDIRRRKTDREPPLGLSVKADPSPKDSDLTDLFSRREINRSLIWGLFRAASMYSAENGIDTWYFLGTKALARIISREGFTMSRIGDVCHHRGERYPFKIDMNEILNNEIWKDDFKNGYRLYSELERYEDMLREKAA